MKADPYFRRSRSRHALTLEQVEEALRHEIEREIQEDGRIRVWAYLEEVGKCVRIILLPDGETVFNAFRDSTFTRKWRRARKSDED